MTPLHRLIVPAVRKPEYEIGLEQVGDATFAHCTVRRWTPRVRQALELDWRSLGRLHGGPIYAQLVPSDPRHERFCRLMGFRPTLLTIPGLCTDEPALCWSP